ncbi:MAG TPA: hypothetical protein VMM60_09360 [Ilumatobacter sp.]|nr:hypothetical protein [Ilumatobacter sp.]
MRSVLAAVIVSTGVLAACGASAPPANELAIEVIDSLQGVSETEKECMRAEVDKYEGEDLDRFAELADQYEQGNTTDTSGAEEMDAFEAALAACRTG